MFSQASVAVVAQPIVSRAAIASRLPETRVVNVALIGASGRIGARLLQLIAGATTTGSTLRLVAAFNSRQALATAAGIDAAHAARNLRDSPQADVAARLDGLSSLPRPLVVVDCSADATVAARYPGWLADGIDIVTPNKLGPSADRVLARRIAASAATGGARVHDAATVGAQLPLLSTLRELHAAGDRVVRFEAVLSGTLSYVLGRIERGDALSAAVRAAVNEGYAEPHPASDLSGEDAARKLVILLRALGRDIELGDIERVPLVDPALLAEPDPALLLRGLAAADETWRARVAVAQARRERWVYRASFEHDALAAIDRVRIAPERVALDHPLAQLAPCENKLVLHSAFYAAAPLTISGPGAGIDLTAACVLGDLQTAARRHHVR